LELLVLCSVMAVFILILLLSMDRIWMYYFIPSFPFAAVPAGWLVARWVKGVLRLVHARFDLPVAAMSFADLIGGVALLGVFILGTAFSPFLEANLGYYLRAMRGDPGQRVSRYRWKDGVLPEFLNQAVRATLWSDQRVIGERYLSFTYLLWHESRTFDLLDEMVAVIKQHSTTAGEIFGDSGTVPLLALESRRKIAGHQVDTNIQRYRSDAAARTELRHAVDSAKTELIILRDRFGVAGVKEIQELVREKYRLLKAFHVSEESAIYRIFERKSPIRR
jgi:hypothetical protein